MDVHLNEFNLPTRIASHDNARPPLSLDIFNLQQSAPAFRDSNMFINRAPLSSARLPSEVIANRPRSWSFGNSNAAQSVDSDNSEITNDLNRLLLAPNPAVRQGVAMLDFGKLEVAPCNSMSRAPPGQPLYSPTYQPGSRWTPKSPVTSRHFCTSDMERSHFSPVELETTERGISPDAIAITHPSPSAFPPSKGDRLAELGYGAGIAHDPRNRASSFTDYCRQDVAVLTPTLNPPDYGHPRTNVFNETRYEVFIISYTENFTTTILTTSDLTSTLMLLRAESGT